MTKLAALLALLVALALCGFLVSVSGVVPIAASSGHWEVTKSILNFSKYRSVSTHTLGLRAPPLTVGDVVKGATHYEVACRGCHGSPERKAPLTIQNMLPVPPDLSRSARRLGTEELFYIVKHGIKFTGMPAYPAQQRDDEVWAIAAFLRRLPDLDAQAYARLASVDPGRPTTGARIPALIATSCARCHGVDGRGGGNAAFPVLAGQRPAYLAASLEAYARRSRHSGVMESAVAGVRPELLREAAEHYASQPRPSPARAADAANAAATARGRAIAEKGIPARDVPACVACHGPGPTERNPVYPSLSGQPAPYLALQLALFQSGTRGGTPYAHLMRPVAHALSAEEIEDVARYYAALE